ncbi:MAG: DUF5667 domain-containing protein [Patescibacteria group bacterium]|nr:DUF5667 domain-containing protein [Patescibacteria group bacterium]
MDEKDLIKNLEAFKEIKPREEWKTFQREILLKQVSGSREGTNLEKAPMSLFTLLLQRLQYLTQPMMAVFLIAAIILGGGFMSVYASKDSIPGDSLYIAKILNEKTQFVLTFNEEKKVHLGLTYAGNRAKEIKELMQTDNVNKNKGDQVEKLVSDFKKEINNAKNRISRINKEKELPITTDEKIIEESIDTGVFSANLKKDEQGIEISSSKVDLIKEEDVEEVINIEKTSTTSEEVLATSSEATLEIESNPEQAILEAQDLLENQDFDGTLSKLEEADDLIDQVGQGEVQGTSTSIIIEEEATSTGENL